MQSVPGDLFIYRNGHGFFVLSWNDDSKSAGPYQTRGEAERARVAIGQFLEKNTGDKQ